MMSVKTVTFFQNVFKFYPNENKQNLEVEQPEGGDINHSKGFAFKVKTAILPTNINRTIS